MADNVPITPGSGADISTDDCGASGHVQRMKLAYSADGVATHVPADADGVLVNLGTNNDVAVASIAAGDNNIGNVDIVTLPALVAGTANIGDVDVLTLPALVAGTANIGDVDVLTLPGIAGDVAHDSADSGNPVKIGAKAVAHGANPTAVAADERTNLYANRAGVLFTIGGHPNIVTVRLQFTAAQTNVAIITAGAGTKIVVTGFQVTLDTASTVFPSVLIGFATTTTPTTTGVIGSHGGVPAGGGFGRGDGSGIVGIGADDEDLRITTVGAATGNGIAVVVSYFTIPS